jgi:hypothetical protein
MKFKNMTNDITSKILELEKETSFTSLSDKDISYFSKKYLDLLELKELEYNIQNYKSHD